MAIVLSFYVVYLAWARIKTVHLGRRAVFRWKRHVFTGSVVLLVLLLGLIGGVIIIDELTARAPVTPWHAVLAVIILVLIVFGLGTGAYMNWVKKKRRTLPVLHGAGNLLLVVLALFQIWTGWHLIKAFLLVG